MSNLEGLLVIEFEGNVIRTLPLTFAMLTIGRAPDNDLSLQHPSISRHHVELSLTREGLILTDLGSFNGTFIDGERILAHQPTRVERGQTLRVGPFILVARRSATDFDELEPDAHHNGEVAARASRAPAVDVGEIERALARRAAARRPSLAPALPIGPRSSYLEFLPSIFAENDFLGRFLLIFESI